MDGDLAILLNEENVGVLGLSLVAVIFLLTAWRHKQGGDRTVSIWLGLVLLIAAVIHFATRNDFTLRWVWMLASLPPLLLASHGAFLYYVRRSVVPKASDENVKRLQDLSLANGKGQAADDDNVETYRRLLAAGERYFSAQALLLRYGGPAVLVLGTSLSIANGIIRYCSPPSVRTHWTPAYVSLDHVRGAAIGLVGAYAYVMLYLGKRSFRLDITPGAAIWCAVTVAVGPVLAAFLGPVVLSGGYLHAPLPLQQKSILFLAGFAPRFVVESLEEAGRRVLSDPSRGALPLRTLPLGQVRGLTRDNQERLEEEGIEDTTHLAMADPYRLLRNTSFDKRQILRWMDSALLMLYFPESFAIFERRGITGAMGLVRYLRDEKALTALAADTRLEPMVLQTALEQLRADRQQKLIRILYSLDNDAPDEAEPSIAGSGKPVPEPGE